MNPTAQPTQSKFKQRIITASILAISVIVGILVVPHFEFILIVSLILVAAAWEWCRLVGLRAAGEQILYLFVLFFAFGLAHGVYPIFTLIIAMIWWLYAIYLLIAYPKSMQWWNKNLLARNGVGFLLLVPCWVALIFIRDVGPGFLLLGLFLIWSTDTGAFLIGRKWGKHKLAPKISPAKTIEGLFGGLLFSLIVAIIGLLLLKIPLAKWPVFLVLALIVSLASVLGDLFESMIKRLVGVKDSGNWLPGHGGLLDRIDSLTCALPVYAFGLLIIYGLHLYDKW